MLLVFAPRMSPGLVLRMYQARPLSPGEIPALFELTHRLARRAGLEQPPALYYVPSRLMNAFSVGQGRETAIAVSDGLLRGLPAREMAGVMAHEISHIANKDLFIMGMADLVGRVVRGLSFVGQVLILINLPMMLVAGRSLPWVPILLLVFAPTLTGLLQLALSRNREFDADLEALRLTGDPWALASALERLEQDQRRRLRLLPWPAGESHQPSLLRTHPVTDERVRRIREMAEAEGQRPSEAEGQRPPEAAGAERFVVPVRFVQPTWTPRRRWHGLWY